MNKFLRFIIEPILDEQGRLSVGRIITLTVFTISLIMWGQQKEIPDQMFNFLLVMIGYVVTNNVQDNIKDVLTKVKQVKDLAGQIIGKKEGDAE